jgi:hypothetical protein
MPTKIVNINGSLNLEASEFQVGLDGFTELVNLRQENGRLVRRKGTGALTTFSSKEIDTLESISHRKLTGVKIADVNTNNLTFTSTTTLTIGGTINTDNIIIPGGATDLTTIFKAGDTIVLSTSAVISTGAACGNKDKALVISSVTTNTIVFTTAVANETVNNNSSAGQAATISFVFDRNDDGTGGSGGTPNNIAISDTNSLNGNALCITYDSGSDKKIALINVTDFGDEDVIDVISGAAGEHIRQKVYTDGIRFACGLDYDPLIFKYINRHHFNGMFKTGYNDKANMMYPTWFMDTAVPVVTANTIILNDSSASDLINTNERIWELDGALDIKNNTYDYKFIPVYDGNQEGLLENPLFVQSTANLSAKKTELSGVLTSTKSAVKIEGKIDLRLLNPRMSGINVYRSTNGGTYYKIKSIYLGDNDPNQETQTFKGGDDAFWFKGDTAPGSTTLDSVEMIVDGFVYEIEAGATPSLDYEGTGYSMVSLESRADQFDHVVKEDANMSREHYGSYYTSKWNHPSEATDIIYADNGEARGGSPNGGWYFAGAETFDVWDDSTDAMGGAGTSAVGLVSNDTSTPGPFNTDFGTGNSGDGSYSPHINIYHDGSPNEDMYRVRLGGSGAVTTDKHIISGWIRASGMGNADARWRIFVSSSDGHDQESAQGLQDIAVGTGGSENQNIDKWRWFQYEITPTGTDLYMYMYMYMPDDGTDTAKVYIKALSVRPSVSNFTLNDNMVGYCGKNIGVSSGLSGLGLPSGTLKGNSIQTVDNHPTVPTADYADRTIITDNNGAFLRTSSLLPLVGTDEAERSDSCFFGTSNYQFYTVDTGTSAHTSTTYVMMDFYDPGLPDGARHPNETATSTDVKFKYATMLNGRQFVANVKITGDEDTEEYPNFVMFSESGSPDIIPTSNFIQLQDLQGGEIVGIETLMSDIVVFMTKGIFRINIPSGDPTNWSLVEAHPNIGCLHDRTIAKAPNGIYFGSKNGIHFLDSGFSVQSITEPIKSSWQTKTTSSPNEETLNLQYDPKYNRLYVSWFPSASTVMYVFDITRQVWYQNLYGGNSTGIKHMSLNHNNELIFIDRGSSSKLQLAEGSNYNDANSSSYPALISMKTGKQILSTLANKTRVRRVNTITERSGGSVTLDLDVITDQGTQSKNSHLNGTQSTRVESTGKYVQIEINSDGDSADNNSYEIQYVDIEHE